MADMRWTFENAYTKVGKFLGLDITNATELATAKDIVYRGYMKFLLPVAPRDGETYVWSFLRQPWKIMFEANKWEYPLPKDWKRFYRKLEYDKDQQGLCIEMTTEQRIMRSRNNIEFSSYPTDYAIRTEKFDKSVGSVKNMIVYPTPSATSVINSTYVMMPDKPESNDDYFIGGPLESECILQCCLAIAENQEDEKLGVETQRAVDLIQALIKDDKGVAPDTVGTVHDSNIKAGSIFSYRDYWIPTGTYTVYGNEI